MKPYQSIADIAATMDHFIIMQITATSAPADMDVDMEASEDETPPNKDNTEDKMDEDEGNWQTSTTKTRNFITQPVTVLEDETNNPYEILSADDEAVETGQEHKANQTKDLAEETARNRQKAKETADKIAAENKKRAIHKKAIEAKKLAQQQEAEVIKKLEEAKQQGNQNPSRLVAIAAVERSKNAQPSQNQQSRNTYNNKTVIEDQGGLHRQETILQISMKRPAGMSAAVHLADIVKLMQECDDTTQLLDNTGGQVPIDTLGAMTKPDFLDLFDCSETNEINDPGEDTCTEKRDRQKGSI